MFFTNTVLPGVTHITDEMGVSFTLIEGRDRALLFDTGYGTENVGRFIKSLTDKPLKVILSHAHHDHVLGARWFRETWLCREDLEEFLMRTGEGQRTKVCRQAEERGVKVPDDFMDAVIAAPRFITFSGKEGPFEAETEELGGRAVRIIRVPGHTPGSIVAYLPDDRLLLTGDNWNPCTWMWFPSSIPVTLWRNNMQILIRTLEKTCGGPAGRVLCSHQPLVRTAAELHSFLEYMTDLRLREAPAEDMNCPINTHAVHCEPEGWTLLFDYDKAFAS